jgi:hypothetical protein
MCERSVELAEPTPRNFGTKGQGVPDPTNLGRVNAVPRP